MSPHRRRRRSLRRHAGRRLQTVTSTPKTEKATRTRPFHIETRHVELPPLWRLPILGGVPRALQVHHHHQCDTLCPREQHDARLRPGGPQERRADSGSHADQELLVGHRAHHLQHTLRTGVCQRALRGAPARGGAVEAHRNRRLGDNNAIGWPALIVMIDVSYNGVIVARMGHCLGAEPCRHEEGHLRDTLRSAPHDGRHRCPRRFQVVQLQMRLRRHRCGGGQALGAPATASRRTRFSFHDVNSRSRHHALLLKGFYSASLVQKFRRERSL